MENRTEEETPTTVEVKLPPVPRLGPQIDANFIKKKSLTHLTRDEIKRTIYVENISSKATLKVILEFFSFCGKVIRQFVFLDEKAENQVAIVVFENENNYSTSLLLTNAVIVDQPIQVYEFDKVLVRKKVVQKKAKVAVRKRVEQQPKEAKPIRESLTDFLATSFVKSGEFVQKVRKSVRKIDTEYEISSQLKKAGEQTKTGIMKIDEKTSFSKTMKEVGSGIALGAKIGVYKTRAELKKLDDKFKITEMTKKTVDNIDQTLKVTENTKKMKEGVERGGVRIRTLAKDVGERQNVKKVRSQVEGVLLEFRKFGDDTKKKVEERKRKSQVIPSGDVMTPLVPERSTSLPEQEEQPQPQEPAQEGEQPGVESVQQPTEQPKEEEEVQPAQQQVSEVVVPPVGDLNLQPEVVPPAENAPQKEMRLLPEESGKPPAVEVSQVDPNAKPEPKKEGDELILMF